MDTFASMEISKWKWAKVTSACEMRDAGRQGSSTHVYSQRWMRVHVLPQLMWAAANLSFIFFLAQPGPKLPSCCQISSFSFLYNWSSWASNIVLEGMHRLIPKAQQAWRWQEIGWFQHAIALPTSCPSFFPDAFPANSRPNPTSKSSFQYNVPQIPKLLIVNHYNKFPVLYSSLFFCLHNTWVFTITTQNFVSTTMLSFLGRIPKMMHSFRVCG